MPRQQYSKHNKPFLVTDTSFQSTIIIPPTWTKWLSRQTENALSPWPVRAKQRALCGVLCPTTNSGQSLFKDEIAFADKVIGRFLSQKGLAQLQGEAAEEIRGAIDEIIGSEHREWRSVGIASMVKKVGDRVGVGVLFGREVLQDERLMGALRWYTMCMGIGIFGSGQLREPILSVVKVLVYLPFRFCKWRVMKLLVPMVRRRMADVKLEVDTGVAGKLRKDVLTQSLGSKMNDGEPRGINQLAEQFLVLVS